MADNPEIKIKVNIDEKDATARLEALKTKTAEVVKVVKDKEQQLAKFGTEAVEMSNAVQILLERAKATGKDNVVATVENAFASVGLENVLKLSADIEKNFKALEIVPAHLQKIVAEATSGMMSLDEAEQKIARLSELTKQLNIDNLEGDTGLLKYDLTTAADLDEITAAWARLQQQVDAEVAAAREVQDAANAKAQALREEKDALDTTSAGYEKQANELLKSAMAYTEIGDKAGAQANKLESFKNKFTEAMSSINTATGTEKAQAQLTELGKTFEQQAARTVKLNATLEAADNDRVERLKKAEKAAADAEAKEKQRAEAEAERARKRAEREEELLEAELARAEKEAYATSLVTLSKQELIAEIERLAAAQKQAADEGDNTAVKKYSEQYATARQRLERLNSELNLNRVALSQQSQTAEMLARQLKTVVGGFSNFEESLENGTVDLAGMANGLYSLTNAFKMGMGPIGWAILALEGLSTAINWYATKQKEAEEAEKKRQERLSKLTTAYIEAAEAANEFVEQQGRNERMDTLKTTFENLNEVLREGKAIADETYRIELARKGLNEDQQQHQFTLKRNAIERDFIAGKITEDEKAAKLDELRLEQALARQQNQFERATKKVDLASEEATRREEARKRIAWERDTLVSTEGGRFKISVAEADKLLTGYDEQVKTVEEARRYGRKTGNWDNLYSAQQALERMEKNIVAQMGYRYESIEDYKKEKASYDDRLKVAEDTLKAATTAAESAKRALESAIADKEITIEAQEQEVRQVRELNRDSAETRRVRNEAKTRKEEEKKAAELAKVVDAAKWAVSSSNAGRLQGDASAAVNWALKRGITDAKDGVMRESNITKLLNALEEAKKTETRADDELFRLLISWLNASKVKDKDMRNKIKAIQKQYL